jgi:hypothetical protein
MNKLQFVSCAVCFAFTATAAQAVEYVAADDNPISQLCVSAALDKPLRFLEQMRELRVATRVVANKVSCNGMNITSFAKQAGNDRNYQHLSRYRRGHVEISDLAQVMLTPQQLTMISGQLSEVQVPEVKVSAMARP